MKIREAPNRIGPGADAVPTEAVAQAQTVAPVDRVTTTEAQAFKASVGGGMNMAATERGSRLQALTQQVRSGAYRPSASALADQILAAAQLDARLAKALG